MCIRDRFCGCEVCKKSRAAGGKNIRTRSQAIIDKKLLIDFPADTYIHMLLNGIELEKIHTCITVSYTHLDVYKRQLSILSKLWAIAKLSLCNRIFVILLFILHLCPGILKCDSPVEY